MSIYKKINKYISKKPIGKIGDIVLVSHLQDNNLQFISDSQDVASIKDHIGRKARDFNAFFVKVGDGDYDEVWGIEETVPKLHYSATRIF
jgi:hypothetical protein